MAKVKVRDLGTVTAVAKKKRDGWAWATVALACVISVVAMWYSFQHHDILLIPDSYSHMRISRNVIDSLTPGLGQLGYSWLPLPQLIMLPFIWNDYLYQTGLAGSIPSMICYITAALFLFLTARKIARNTWASFVGTLVFILNPNAIYMQTTPLTELLCLATFAMAGYFFVTWVQESKSKYLVLAANCAFLATIARYDGWFLFLSMFVLTLFIGVVQRRKWIYIQANLILFGLVGSAGIFLWLIWNKVIFGDPLTFAHGAYSSHEQMEYNFPMEMKVVTHNFLQSMRYYGFTCLDVVGPIVCILAIISLALFIVSHRNISEKLATLSFITPLAFYVFSFYTGQVLSLPPEVSTRLFNMRFGTEAILPSALFIATFPNLNPQLPRWLARAAIPAVLGILIIAQSVSIMSNGILTLEEGQYGWSCTARQAVNIYLAQHYNGGLILEDFYLGLPSESQEVGIHTNKIIYQGSQKYWKKALRNPGVMVDWVIIDRSSRDLYPIQVNTTTPQFQSQFFIVVSQQTFVLYQKRGIQIPTKPIPPQLLSEHPYCGTGKRPSRGGW